MGWFGFFQPVLFVFGFFSHAFDESVLSLRVSGEGRGFFDQRHFWFFFRAPSVYDDPYDGWLMFYIISWVISWIISCPYPSLILSALLRIKKMGGLFTKTTPSWLCIGLLEASNKNWII